MLRSGYINGWTMLYFFHWNARVLDTLTSIISIRRMDLPVWCYQSFLNLCKSDLFCPKHSFFCMHTTPELILSVFAFLYSGNSCLWSRLQLFSSTVWNMMFSLPTEWSTTRVRASVHWTGTRSPFLMRFYLASSALRGQCVRFIQSCVHVRRWAPLYCALNSALLVAICWLLWIFDLFKQLLTFLTNSVFVSLAKTIKNC